DGNKHGRQATTTHPSGTRVAGVSRLVAQSDHADPLGNGAGSVLDGVAHRLISAGSSAVCNVPLQRVTASIASIVRFCKPAGQGRWTVWRTIPAISPVLDRCWIN